MTIDLSGKTALITGATGQLGRVMATTLASCGADVAVHYLQNAVMAETLAEKIRGMGRRVLTVQADITDEASVNRMRDAVVMALGSPDIVVNNAVIQYPWTDVARTPLADFQSQFNSCIMQSVLTAKAFMPAMRERRWGRFIGVNTECSYLCEAETGAYAAAKMGMTALYRVLAKEAGADNVTVNQIAPGWTISDRHRLNGTEVNEAYAAKIPMGRRGTDEEVANVVLFLASELSSFVTGVCIPVCGGAVMV
jgi:3-oxoacyl-[acyl-carrier protein] reductase